MRKTQAAAKINEWKKWSAQEKSMNPNGLTIERNSLIYAGHAWPQMCSASPALTSLLRRASSVFPLQQSFSNFNACMSYLGILLTWRFWSSRYGAGLKNLHFEQAFRRYWCCWWYVDHTLMAGSKVCFPWTRSISINLGTCWKCKFWDPHPRLTWKQKLWSSGLQIWVLTSSPNDSDAL